MATRLVTIILGILQKKQKSWKSWPVCDCTCDEILQLWIISGHCKHCIGILDTFCTPNVSSVFYNYKQIMLPLSGGASFAVPWNDKHFRANWAAISCSNSRSFTMSFVFCCCILFHIFLMEVLDSPEYLVLGSWLLLLLLLTEHFCIIRTLRVIVAPKHTCRQRIRLPDILTSDTSISVSPCWGMTMASGMVTPSLVNTRNKIWAEHPQYHYNISYNNTALSFPIFDASYILT